MKYLNRWVYVIVGVMVLVFAGLVYAWSVLSAPIAVQFPEWSKTQLSFAFTIVMTFFCLGGLIGGLLANKVNVRINVWMAAVFFLGGFFLAAAAASLWTLYLGFGVLCGFASGLAYNAVMSTMSKWFPDKQGLVSGILLMGFGVGSFVIGKVYQAYTPGGAEGWRTSFRIFGMILFVVMAVSGFFFVKPGEDAKLPERKQGKAKNNKEGSMDVGVKAMLTRPAFWLYFGWSCLLGIAGLAVISQAGGIVLETAGEGISGGTVATAVGIISIANGSGRVIFGGLYDKYGRKISMMTNQVVFLLATIAMIFALGNGNFPLLILGFVLCGAAYGGITATNSAFISSYYGASNYPVNFSVVTLNLMVASFGGTIAGALFDASQSYYTTLIMTVAAVLIGMVCSARIKRP